jgi:non-heme chloroperoxidase
MPFVTTPDNAQIFYKDWGNGRPVVFSHGWPLTSDVWDNQLMMVADYGYRAIAHDRRGGGRPARPGTATTSTSTPTTSRPFSTPWT